MQNQPHDIIRKILGYLDRETVFILTKIKFFRGFIAANYRAPLTTQSRLFVKCGREFCLRLCLEPSEISEMCLKLSNANEVPKLSPVASWDLLGAKAASSIVFKYLDCELALECINSSFDSAVLMDTRKWKLAAKAWAKVTDPDDQDLRDILAYSESAYYVRNFTRAMIKNYIRSRKWLTTGIEEAMRVACRGFRFSEVKKIYEIEKHYPKTFLLACTVYCQSVRDFVNSEKIRLFIACVLSLASRDNNHELMKKTRICAVQFGLTTTELINPYFKFYYSDWSLLDFATVVQALEMYNYHVANHITNPLECAAKLFEIQHKISIESGKYPPKSFRCLIIEHFSSAKIVSAGGLNAIREHGIVFNNCKRVLPVYLIHLIRTGMQWELEDEYISEYGRYQYAKQLSREYKIL